MAFIVGEEEEGQPGMETLGPQQDAGGAFIPTGGATPGQPGPAPQKAASGSFTNLQQYIEANRPKAEQMAQKITSGLKQEAQTLRGGVAQQREKALGEGSQLATEQTRIEQAQPFIQQQIAQAGQGTQDVERFARIRQEVAPQYQAPELTAQRASAKDLERRSKAFGTAEGRFEELSRTVGREGTSYTGGQRSLDALLLAGDRGQRLKSIKAAQEATAGLGQQIGTLEGDISSQIAAQRVARGELAEQATSGVAARQAGIKGDVSEQLTAAQGQQDLIRDKMRRGEQLSSADLQALGMAQGSLSKGLLDRNYGVQAGDLLRLGDLGAGDVRTAEQAAQQNALRALAGQVPTDIQAGTGQLGTGAQGYVDEISRVRGEYRTEKSGLEEQIFTQRAAEQKEIDDAIQYATDAARRTAGVGGSGDVNQEALDNMIATLKRKQAARTTIPGLEQQLAGIDARYGGAPTIDPTAGGKYAPPPPGAPLPYAPVGKG